MARPLSRWRHSPVARCSFAFATLLLSVVLVPPAHGQMEPATVRVGVFSLFHPGTLVLTVARPTTLLLDGRPLILPASHPLTLQATLAGFTAGSTAVDGSHGSDASPLQTLALAGQTPLSQTFTLTVPGKLTRTYRGALTLTSRARTLVPVVQMDVETAVASIVAAESPPHAPWEALKAQSIVARSFLLGTRHTHAGFDACDTTHCQFLRSPPLDSSLAARATLATRGLVLAWHPTADSAPRIVAAMYSRSCGGHTRARVSPDPEAYPFYSVSCDFCLRHPEVWTRTHPVGEALTSEQQRLAYNRTHGWSAVPSDVHTQSGDTLSGRGSGHGIGLCQLGAADLAARGASSAAILEHFFPNTSILHSSKVSYATDAR